MCKLVSSEVKYCEVPVSQGDQRKDNSVSSDNMIKIKNEDLRNIVTGILAENK